MQESTYLLSDLLHEETKSEKFTQQITLDALQQQEVEWQDSVPSFERYPIKLEDN